MSFTDSPVDLWTSDGQPVSEHDLREMYIDMLNETLPPVKVGGHTFDPDRVIELCDPVAFRCGLVDYADSLSDDVSFTSDESLARDWYDEQEEWQHPSTF
jgi:hypothetical protein